MSGGKDKIHEHPNAGSNGFEKNPQNINRNGRPRKPFASINQSLKERGIEPISKSELLNSFQLIFNATEDELQELVEDPETPLAYKLMVRELRNEKTASKALTDLRNYLFGKAPEKQAPTRTKIKVRMKGSDGKYKKMN
jgi:hypothetical protein